MIHITKKKFDNKPDTAVYSDIWGENPEWKGRKTMLGNKNGETVLLIEGIDFKII